MKARLAARLASCSKGSHRIRYTRSLTFGERWCSGRGGSHHITRRGLSMSEKEWVEYVVGRIGPLLQEEQTTLQIWAHKNLPYAHEVRSYEGQEPSGADSITYQTDILVTETLDGERWTPRVVVEAKLQRINTHDAIPRSTWKISSAWAPLPSWNPVRFYDLLERSRTIGLRV